MKQLSVLFLLLSFGLSSCGGGDKKAEAAAREQLAKERSALTQTYWKLVTLYGKDVVLATGQEREAYIRINDDGSVSGYGGCNPIDANYNLQTNLRIRFIDVNGGANECTAKATQQKLMKALAEADNYSVYNNQLNLNKAKMAPLAVFEKVQY